MKTKNQILVMILLVSHVANSMAQVMSFQRSVMDNSIVWTNNDVIELNEASKGFQGENSNEVNVTCVFNNDDNYSNTSGCKYVFMDVDDSDNKFIVSGGTKTVKLPQGRYDLVACYPYLNNISVPKTFFVVREQVSITCDTTFSLFPDEAKICIQFQPRLPSGEICQMPIFEHINDTSGDYISLGNISSLYFTTSLVLKETKKNLWSNTSKWTTVSVGAIEYNANHFSNMYINEVSSRFNICSCMTFSNEAGFYQVNFNLENCVDTIITNCSEDYRIYEAQFKQTPRSKSEGEVLIPTIKSTIYDTKGGISGVHMFSRTQFVEDENESVRYYFCNAFESNNDFPLIQFSSASAVECESLLDIWESGCNILGKPIVNEHGELRHLYNGIASYGDMTYYNYPDSSRKEGISYYPSYPGNSQFSKYVENSKTIYGNSCPILVPTLQSFSDTENDISKYLTMNHYIGRNSEDIERDMYVAKTSVYVNEELVTEGEGMFFWPWTKSAESQGLVDITVTNDNVDVDGIPGKNVTNIHFNMAGEDNTAPTLQMLDFRDQDGNAIDRFDTVEEGKLQFYCGDFNERYMDNEYHTQYFVCNDLVGVEVAYSPYQADTWTALGTNEVAEYYYDGMGHYYAAPLASVTGEAYEGWFDLKIKLTDAAGNWQEQVISPAFRIDNLAYSNVATVGSDNAREVARYNLAGQRVDGDAKGVVIVKMSDGTARKVIM
ncbi:MAG: hypothetical protein J5980_04125 [Muribaculaceae bacterium]|nr:hypothetical protein [Muribaculaceae bacterium]